MGNTSQARSENDRGQFRNIYTDLKKTTNYQNPECYRFMLSGRHYPDTCCRIFQGDVNHGK